MNVATKILEQLGGNRFLAMTGSKNLVNHGNALSMKFPKPRGRQVNYLKITLEPADMYTMEFGYIRGLNYTPHDPITGVYARELQEIFTAKTGLDTHL